MKIERLLILGIGLLAFFIVLATTTFLTVDMLKMAEANLNELNSVSESVKKQNETMFDNLSRQAAEVTTNIVGTTEGAAIEQLRNVGSGIAEEIKAVMNMPFASVQSIARTVYFEKIEAERLGQTPSRDRVERFMLDFLVNNNDACAVFSCWEKNAFDGKDAEFVGKENADEEMDTGNPDYVSEGAFLPWFYKTEGKDGKERIVRGFTDDYLTSDYKYYTGPRDSKKEFITEPYVDAGIPITSFCVPVLKDDVVLGVVGIDIGLSKLQEIVEKRKPFETGFAMFFSPEGQVVYYPDEKINYEDIHNEDNGEIEKTYRRIDDIPALAETAKRIKEKKPIIYTSTTLPGREGTEMLVIHIPVRFGDYPAIWTVAVAAPVSQVMANRDKARGDMDRMVAGIETQNETFVKELDTQIVQAVEASEAAKTNSFWQSIIVSIIVLIVSVAVGIFFAVWVNRSIEARDFWYRQILDAATDPMSVVDTAMKIMFINKPGLTLLQKNLDDCVGCGIEEIWKPALGKEYDTSGLRVLQAKGQTLSQAEFNGSYWDVTSNYIVDVRNVRSGMIEIFKDVSDRENVFHLVETVDDVIRSTVEQTGSITQAAADLSQGAAQQAESVESITVDMKTANEQATNNSGNADQANRLSEDAGRSATLGQQRMREMVAAMNQISDNAQSMRAVIKTIDDIAFQTNLLALNAAVEAARAGTHGKGFAVVAEEVRNLAARSAKAAKETEELIIKSNQQIAGGVTVADQTAEALNAIAGHVGEVSTLIRQIAESSKEQTVGVNRMTSTLQTVDQITQQNVELASTTANATQLLSTEVQELQELVEQIRKKD